MSEFIIPEVRDLARTVVEQHFALPRAVELKSTFSKLFSYHLGCLENGSRFETSSILVTGRSRAGKTKEIRNLLSQFNQSQAMLPTGEPARFVECVLSGKGTWKDLGRDTARAIGYPLGENSRLTQAEIWNVVVREAKLSGVIGIHYDETQHIFFTSSEKGRLTILDSFKTLMKSHEWPLMLIFSGVPELTNFLKQEQQLFNLVHQVPFNDISLPDDVETVHEIVCSFAMLANVEVNEELRTQDFYERLVAGSAYRWGLVCVLVVDAISDAKFRSDTHLRMEHFVDSWVAKTSMSKAASPYFHSNFKAAYRIDHPFIDKLS